MIGPLEDNLLSQTMATLIPLCIGAAVLTFFYLIGVWVVGALRRRFTVQRVEPRRFGRE